MGGRGAAAQMNSYQLQNNNPVVPLPHAQSKQSQLSPGAGYRHETRPTNCGLQDFHRFVSYPHAESTGSSLFSPNFRVRCRGGLLWSGDWTFLMSRKISWTFRSPVPAGKRSAYGTTCTFLNSSGDLTTKTIGPGSRMEPGES